MTDDTRSPGTHFIDLGDIRACYEIHGEGEPLIMLHGGFHSNNSWRQLIDELASNFQVIAYESRGQGRTSPGNGPITYARMTHDVVCLLDALDVKRAHFVGHSDGGCLCLNLLTDFADRVLTATLIGTPYNFENYPSDTKDLLHKLMAALKNGDDVLGLRSRYEAMAPNPKDWMVMVDRLSKTWLSQPILTTAVLQTIEKPALVVRCEQDQYLPVEVFETLAAVIPGAKTLNIPEGTHNVIAEFPSRLAAGIKKFTEETR